MRGNVLEIGMMKDAEKTQAQLIEELAELRQRVRELAAVKEENLPAKVESGDAPSSERAGELRGRAEERLSGQRAKIQDTSELTSEEIRPLIHELEVHQIELERQNEELRQAQIELAEAHDRHVDLYDFAPIGYFISGEKGLIQEVNLPGATLLGMERRSLLNQPLTRFIVPEDQDLFYRHQRQAFSTQTRQMCELRMQKKNGASFYAQLESVVTSDSRYYPHALRVAVIDITERKQREQELRASEERYRKLLDLCD